MNRLSDFIKNLQYPTSPAEGGEASAKMCEMQFTSRQVIWLAGVEDSSEVTESLEIKQTEDLKGKQKEKFSSSGEMWD